MPNEKFTMTTSSEDLDEIEHWCKITGETRNGFFRTAAKEKIFRLKSNSSLFFNGGNNENR